MTVQNINNVSQTFSMQDIANITQPKPSGWSKFTSITMGGIAGAASSFIPGAGIVSGLLGGLGGGTGLRPGRKQPDAQLLQMRYQDQQETQMFNLL